MISSVLDKAKLEPSEFSAYSLGNDPDDTTLWLYYSPMITVDGPICSRPI